MSHAHHLTYASLASSLHTWVFTFVGPCYFSVSFYILNAAGHLTCAVLWSFLTLAVKQVRQGAQQQLEGWSGSCCPPGNGSRALGCCGKIPSQLQVLVISCSWGHACPTLPQLACADRAVWQATAALSHCPLCFYAIAWWPCDETCMSGICAIDGIDVKDYAHVQT